MRNRPHSDANSEEQLTSTGLIQCQGARLKRRAVRRGRSQDENASAWAPLGPEVIEFWLCVWLSAKWSALINMPSTFWAVFHCFPHFPEEPTEAKRGSAPLSKAWCSFSVELYHLILDRHEVCTLRIDSAKHTPAAWDGSLHSIRAELRVCGSQHTTYAPKWGRKREWERGRGEGGKAGKNKVMGSWSVRWYQMSVADKMSFKDNFRYRHENSKKEK